MGMTEASVLRKVQLPIALPLILDGIRLSAAAVIATATLAALVGWGGLGPLHRRRLRRARLRARCSPAWCWSPGWCSSPRRSSRCCCASRCRRASGGRRRRADGGSAASIGARRRPSAVGA